MNARISLDSLDPDNFSEICGCSPRMARKVMQNIELLAGIGKLSRVAAVVTRDNVDEIGDLIDFCEGLQINLKLFDMYSTPKTKKEWMDAYSGLSTIKSMVEEKSVNVRQIEYTKHFGIPALEYMTLGGITVRIKDSFSGTRYNQEICSDCSSMPCQEGLYTILYSSDKNLIPCRLSPIHYIADAPSDFGQNLIYIIGILQRAYHENRFWGNER